MGFSEIQLLFAALFILCAVVIGLLFSLMKVKRQKRRMEAPAAKRPAAPKEPDGFTTMQEIRDNAAARRARTQPQAGPVRLRPDAETVNPGGKQILPPTPVARPIAAPDSNAGAMDNSKALQLPPVTIDAFLLELLLTGRSKEDLARMMSQPAEPPEPAVPQPQFEVIQRILETGTPSGMIDQAKLQKLIDFDRPFTGVVISIGINEDGQDWHSQAVLDSVNSYIQGLLGPEDFGCQTDTQEYVIACPGHQGANAQRRFSQISERLWDYQLRGMSVHSISFSWGGVTVNEESLAEAIYAATERMRQSVRSRTPIQMKVGDRRRTRF